jgi:hypothetical protein
VEIINWKQIPLEGYELYEVSNFGEVRKRNTMFINKTAPSRKRAEFRYIDFRLNHKGYLCTALKRKAFLIHRLVCITFKPQPDLTLHVNHIDGNKLNNYYLNLEWCTNAENMQHAILTGIHNNTGENNVNCKYTDEQIHEARVLYWQGYQPKDISRMININCQTLPKFLNWRDRFWQRTVIPNYQIESVREANSYGTEDR